jgi:hypothetical protein
MEATIKADKKKDLQEKKEQEQEDKESSDGQWNVTAPMNNEQRRVILNVDTPMFGESETW